MALTRKEKEQIRQEEISRLKVEKERERVRKQLKAEEKAKKSAQGCAGCFVVLILLCVVGFLFPRGSTTPSRRNSPQTTSPPARQIVATGEEGRLNNGAANVLVAIDAESLSRLTKLSVANDKEGMIQLMLTGRVFAVPSDTKVRMLDPGFLKSEVRILEGEQYGRSGFVPAEWVTR